MGKENNFVWYGGASKSFTNWNGGEPNNWLWGEDCTETYANGKWNDQSCGDSRSYICQKKDTAKYFDSSDNQQFIVHNTVKNFDSARDACKKTGGVLAHPTVK